MAILHGRHFTQPRCHFTQRVSAVSSAPTPELTCVESPRSRDAARQRRAFGPSTWSGRGERSRTTAWESAELAEVFPGARLTELESNDADRAIVPPRIGFRRSISTRQGHGNGYEKGHDLSPRAAEKGGRRRGRRCGARRTARRAVWSVRGGRDGPPISWMGHARRRIGSNHAPGTDAASYQRQAGRRTDRGYRICVTRMWARFLVFSRTSRRHQRRPRVEGNRTHSRRRRRPRRRLAEDVALAQAAAQGEAGR